MSRVCEKDGVCVFECVYGRECVFVCVMFWSNYHIIPRWVVCVRETGSVCVWVCVWERECECECVCESVFVCAREYVCVMFWSNCHRIFKWVARVCVRERERECVSACVIWSNYTRYLHESCVCVSVCVRERESVCACERERVCVRVWVMFWSNCHMISRWVVCVWERGRMCVCVWERESVCKCMYNALIKSSHNI